MIEEQPLNIACLGWGSLIWKPEALPLAGEWYQDGPELPVEFCRVGDKGELATALCCNAPSSQVLWALLAVDSVEQACASLREREQIAADRQDGIGVFIPDKTEVGPLAEWAAVRKVDAIIWTALPPRLDAIEGRLPSLKDALGYLDGLSGERLEHARHYIEQVPRQIDTPYRRAICKRFGWGQGQ